MIATAVEIGNRAAIAFAFEGMSDTDTADLVRAVCAYLEQEARRNGDWRAWAEAQWLLPHSWGPGALEFQARSDARIRASEPSRARRNADPCRKEIARLAMRLLRGGIGAREFLARLHAYNEALPEPLSASIVESTALWAAEQRAGARHGL